MSNRLVLDDLYRESILVLKQTDIETPEYEAALLIEYVTGFTRTEQIINGSQILPQSQISEIESLLRRRLSGEPLDNIMGEREFYGLAFKVTRDVLSPRPETEMLVDYILSKSKPDQSARILDIGTGSGAIPISIIKSRPKFEAVAVDLSKAALKLASYNAKKHGVDRKIEFLNGSWFEPVKGRFDFVISNPPYIADEAMEDLAVEVRDYDPNLALCGGVDGLMAYKQIAQSSGQFLSPGGTLCLEIGFDQGRSVPNLLKSAGFDEIMVHKDLSGHDRMIIAHMRDQSAES